jgi:phosphatidylserine decarboxylase
MLCRKTEIIAKEGWGYIGLLIFLFILSLLFDLTFLSFLLFSAIIFVSFIFRNPERIPYEIDEFSIFSPIDGKIVYIGKVKEDKYFKKDMLLVSVKSSLCDVTLLRNPLDLDIKKVNTVHGLRLDVKNEKAKLLNERVEIIGTSFKGDILLTCIAGKYSKKIYRFCENFKKVRKGDRYLFLNEGLIDLYLPLECRIKVVEGEKVKAVETVLGYFLDEK